MQILLTQITVEAAIRVRDDLADDYLFSMELDIIPAAGDANKQTINIPLTVGQDSVSDPMQRESPNFWKQ